MYGSTRLRVKHRMPDAQLGRPDGARRRMGKKGSPAPFSRNLARLLACAFVFSAISIVKVVYPQSAQSIRDFIAQKVNPGIDYRAAAEAIGRAVNGRGNIAEVVGVLKEGLAGFGASAGSAESPKPADAEKVPPASGDVLIPAESGALPSSGADTETTSPAPGQVPENSSASPEADSKQTSALASRSGQNVKSGQDKETVDELSFSLDEKDFEDDTPKNAFVLPLPDHVDTDYHAIGFPTTVPARGEVTSEFGYRDHPINGETKFHYGIDIGAPAGSDVVCFADGVVEAVGVSTVYGNYVRVLHKDGFLSFYGHMSKVYVKNGQSVKLGGRLGLVGQTGLATGPHLHFEVHLGDLILNPRHYVSPDGK